MLADQPKLASTDGARGAHELVRDDDLLNLLAEHVLEGFGEGLVLLLLFLALLLLLVCLLELKVLGDVNELLAVELLELRERRTRRLGQRGRAPRSSWLSMRQGMATSRLP